MKSEEILNSMGIEIDPYPADAIIANLIGTYSKDRKTVCIMIEDNEDAGTQLSKETVKEIAYTVTTLITNFGLDIHSYDRRNTRPFNQLNIIKAHQDFHHSKK